MLYDPREPGREGLDRGAVEEVRRVLEVADHTEAGDVGHVEEQVELRGVGGRVLEVHAQAFEREVLTGHVLPGEHHLEQRVVGGGAVGFDQFHQALEGRVLVLVGGQGLLAHLAEEPLEARVSGQVCAQHPRVDEEAHQLRERGVGAAGDRRSDGDVVAAAQVVQQDRHGRLEDHRHRRALRAGEFFHGGDQVRIELERHQVAATARHRRPGAIRRQLQRLRHARQFVPPVPQLGGEDTVGVGLVGEQFPLPQGVVDVLHRRLRPVGLRTSQPGGVGRAQVARQRTHRLAVPGDVVDHEDQHVLVGGAADHGRPQRYLRGQVERPGRDGRHRVRHRVRCGLDDVQVHRCRRGGQHPLVRHSVTGLGDQRPQYLVPRHDVPYRVLQRRHVQRAGEPQHERDVVRGRRPLEPVDEPQAALRERQRRLLRALCRPAQRGADARSRRDPLDQFHDGGTVEDRADRDLGAQFGADPADQPGGEERVPAQGEEVVVDAHPVDAEDLGEQRAENLFLRCPRRPARGHTGVVGHGQRLPVQLPVGGQGHLGDRDHGRGHHVLRQPFLRVVAEPGDEDADLPRPGRVVRQRPLGAPSGREPSGVRPSGFGARGEDHRVEALGHARRQGEQQADASPVGPVPQVVRVQGREPGHR